MVTETILKQFWVLPSIIQLSRLSKATEDSAKRETSSAKLIQQTVQVIAHVLKLSFYIYFFCFRDIEFNDINGE
jgi:hypothetical protein